MQKKSIWICLMIIPLAILNGILREKVFVPCLGMQYADPLSGIILCLLIFAITLIFIPWLGKGTQKQFLQVGLIWLFLTIIFEAVWGAAMGLSAREILRTYNLTTGNLWLIVVLFTWFAPFWAARIRGLIVDKKQ